MFLESVESFFFFQYVSCNMGILCANFMDRINIYNRIIRITCFLELVSIFIESTMAKEVEGRSVIPTCDAYFEAIQSRKRLPSSLQESLTAAFAQIPVSSFPEVPAGKGTPTNWFDQTQNILHACSCSFLFVVCFQV